MASGQLFVYIPLQTVALFEEKIKKMSAIEWATHLFGFLFAIALEIVYKTEWFMHNIVAYTTVLIAIINLFIFQN